MNSDLLAVNFTDYTDNEVHEALYHANKKLINRYQELQRENNEKICYDLYMNRNVAFRGFRQS